MNTGRYPYFTLSHQLSQPVRYHLVINFTGLSPYSREGTVTKFKEELNPVGLTVIRIQKICY